MLDKAKVVIWRGIVANPNEIPKTLTLSLFEPKQINQYGQAPICLGAVLETAQLTPKCWKERQAFLIFLETVFKNRLYNKKQLQELQNQFIHSIESIVLSDASTAKLTKLEIKIKNAFFSSHSCISELIRNCPSLMAKLFTPEKSSKKEAIGLRWIKQSQVAAVAFASVGLVGKETLRFLKTPDQYQLFKDAVNTHRDNNEIFPLIQYYKKVRNDIIANAKQLRETDKNGFKKIKLKNGEDLQLNDDLLYFAMQDPKVKKALDLRQGFFDWFMSKDKKNEIEAGLIQHSVFTAAELMQVSWLDRVKCTDVPFNSIDEKSILGNLILTQTASHKPNPIIFKLKLSKDLTSKYKEDICGLLQEKMSNLIPPNQMNIFLKNQDTQEAALDYLRRQNNFRYDYLGFVEYILQRGTKLKIHLIDLIIGKLTPDELANWICFDWKIRPEPLTDSMILENKKVLAKLNMADTSIVQRIRNWVVENNKSSNLVKTKQMLAQEKISHTSKEMQQPQKISSQVLDQDNYIKSFEEKLKTQNGVQLLDWILEDKKSSGLKVAAILDYEKNMVEAMKNKVQPIQNQKVESFFNVIAEQTTKINSIMQKLAEKSTQEEKRPSNSDVETTPPLEVNLNILEQQTEALQINQNSPGDFIGDQVNSEIKEESDKKFTRNSPQISSLSSVQTMFSNKKKPLIINTVSSSPQMRRNF